MVLWKAIEGFPNYEVSNTGLIRNKRGRILRPAITSGYYRVTLCNKGLNKNIHIHRLVASAFIDNPINLPIVNHIDGDKLNNSVENLEWCTFAHNNKHACDTGLKSGPKGEKSGTSKLTWKQVRWIRANFVKGSKDLGCTALARKFKVSHSVISEVICNKTWVE